jgi:hypothetical protein
MRNEVYFSYAAVTNDARNAADVRFSTACTAVFLIFDTPRTTDTLALNTWPPQQAAHEADPAKMLFFQAITAVTRYVY